MSQVSQDAVYILNRREYKESSLLLEIISPNYGRLSVIANGALKGKKGWSALLQVFQPLIMIWAGKSSLKTLVSVDAPSPALSLHGRRLFCAYYLNELVLKLLPQDQASTSNLSTLFIHYAKSLEDLSSSSDLELPLREFEYHLLSDLGLLPDLAYDVEGKLILADDWYNYIPNTGFQLTHQVHESGSNYFLGIYLIKFADFSLEMYSEKEYMLQIKRLMRSLIHDLLDGQELKSRALFQSYQPFRSTK